MKKNLFIGSNHHSEYFSKHRSALASAAQKSPQIKFGVITVLCLLSIAGNNAISYLSFTLHFPIFLDTIFTIAITFYAGLAHGLIVATLHNPIITLIECAMYKTEIFYFDFLYALCGEFHAKHNFYLVCKRLNS